MTSLLTTAIDALNARIAQKGLSQSISLVIKDEGTIRVDASGARLDDSPADCTLTASAKTFQGLLDGSVNPMTAVMLGKLKLRGDMGAAMKLGALLG